jgi:hypothetical protein
MPGAGSNIDPTRSMRQRCDFIIDLSSCIRSQTGKAVGPDLPPTCWLSSTAANGSLWGRTNLQAADELRRAYIDALKVADVHDGTHHFREVVETSGTSISPLIAAES